MRRKPYWRTPVAVLCAIVLLGTAPVFALSEAGFGDGSVKILPSAPRARLAVEVAPSEKGGRTGGAVKVCRQGEKAQVVEAGETYRSEGETGTVYVLSYQAEKDRVPILRMDAAAQGAVVSGDVRADRQEALCFRGTGASGEVLIEMNGEAAKLTVAFAAVENKPHSASEKAQSEIVMEGEFLSEGDSSAKIKTRYRAEPAAASYAGAVREMKRSNVTSGTITAHKQHNDGHRNLASVFSLEIDGMSYSGACADGKNFKTGEKGTAVTLTALDRGSKLTRLAYLESRNYWNRKNYNDLDYHFALVNAARKLNGRPPAYERYASRALCGRMMSDAESNRDTIPESFKAYLAYPSNGGQVILAWGMARYGKVQVVKTVGDNKALTVECGGVYSLAGAVYTVYDENNVAAGTMTTDASGRSGSLELEPGNYTVRETRAPNGFALDKESYRIAVASDKTVTVESKDAPLFAPITIFLEKVAEGESYLNKGDMAGAEFLIKYYDRMGEDLGKTRPAKVWRLKTTKDTNGKYTATLDEKHLLAGSDPLFVTEQGVAVLPRGTVTIQETKAPRGYVLDRTIYTRRIDGAENGEALTFHSGKVSEHTNKAAVPEIGTKARDKATGEALGAYGKESVLVDTVRFRGLSEGETYTLRGTLMDRESGKALLDEAGKELSATKTFTVTAENATVRDGIADGSVDVTYRVDTTRLAGKTTVFFEELLYEGRVIAAHKDLRDEGQTVFFPEIGTTARSESSGSNLGVPGEEEVLVDTVTYRNLIVGKEYTVSGILKDKESGKSLLDAKGKEITAEKRFVAEKSEGVIALEFRYDSRLRQGRTTVVFENLYHRGILVATHADLRDEKQSIDYPDIGTKMTGTGGRKIIGKGKEAVLTDTIRFDHFLPGKEYRVKGQLMVKATGKPLLEKGIPVTAETSFVPDRSSGSVAVVFRLDTEKLAGKELVAFETAYDAGGKVIARHEDLSNRDQTVSVMHGPKTGDGRKIVGELFLLLAALEAVVLLTVKRRCGRL